jgi:(S)-mandelate dehydrogenase
MRRRFWTRGAVEQALCIEELRAMARRRLPGFAFEYIDGGAEDEVTLRRNRKVFESVLFVPDTLVDVGARDCRTTLFGREVAVPLVVAPTGLNGVAWPAGDTALARAAAAEGVPFTLSTVSNLRLERLAAQSIGRRWMQLYLFEDPAITLDILDRARRAGFEALVFTSDANIPGNREWDRRNYRAPGRLRPSRWGEVALHPRWALGMLGAGRLPRFENIADYLPTEARSASAGATVFPRLMRGSLSWDDVHWLRERWEGTLIIKGIMSADDARRAADAGCEGIVLTNHGGRQLDGCASPMDLLPEVAQAVGERLTILVDSGFRRGTDVVKALALGADAVMVGRAALYGLAAGGEPGARHALALLKAEVLRTLGLLGCRSVADLSPRLLRAVGRDQR